MQEPQSYPRPQWIHQDVNRLLEGPLATSPSTDCWWQEVSGTNFLGGVPGWRPDLINQPRSHCLEGAAGAAAAPPTHEAEENKSGSLGPFGAFNNIATYCITCITEWHQLDRMVKTVRKMIFSSYLSVQNQSLNEQEDKQRTHPLPHSPSNAQALVTVALSR